MDSLPNSYDAAATAGDADLAGKLAANPSALKASVLSHLKYGLGKTPEAAALSDWRQAMALALRDRAVDIWFDSTRSAYDRDLKRVYYLSMEFLIGRVMEDAAANLGLVDAAKQAAAGLGLDYRALVEDEPDAALGNGGLGRLAACFMESLASLGIPATGYGIRYRHGLFHQEFDKGWQVEEAETWLNQHYVWEFERLEAAYDVCFGGSVSTKAGKRVWTPSEHVIAAAYDTPVIGWQGRWVNTLRLWTARPAQNFDLSSFNRGDYLRAAAPEVLAETISRQLYPNDTTPQGKELRLKQEYFFTSASIQDILRRFRIQHRDLRLLPEKVAIQLNDTHPAIAGPELVRILVDLEGMAMAEAILLARDCLAYTNHTLLPEALERWPVEMLGRILPRHLELAHEIETFHKQEVEARGRRVPASVRIVDGGEVRMGDLAFISAHRVNGVSALHSDLMAETVFRDLHSLHPQRIVNETNGITPRRWLYTCNPALSRLVTESIGDAWVGDLERIEELAPLADDAQFRQRFAAAKQSNKDNLTAWIEEHLGIAVRHDALFDIQIKRMHEYKRQLLNILETAALADEIRLNPKADWTPRVKIFGGKAAPGYIMAKMVIKLINDIGSSINSDPVIGDRLKVVYPANYNVSMAELLIPAADLSEQISTAGMEASGTGNMKLALNGALTVGTLDGANVEIKERVGDDNIFIFGLTADEVQVLRAGGHDPAANIRRSKRLAKVLSDIESGRYSPDDKTRFKPLIDGLRGNDWFMVTDDFDAYYEIQRKIDTAFLDKEAWTRSAVLNTAGVGWFSSDRSIRGYARDIWDVKSALE